MSTSASVDDRGHPGAMLSVGASFAPFVRDQHAVLVTATLEGGVVQPRPVVGELRGALAVEWLARLAAAADYDWGSHHGLFLVGPSFEGYVDLCD